MAFKEASMKKQIITLVSVLLVLGLLVAALIMLSKEPETQASSETASDSSVTLYSGEKADVVKLRVENESGEFTINRTGEDAWKVDGLSDYPVDDTSVESAVSSAASFVARRAVAESAEDLSEYGLDKPSTSFYVKFEDGGVHELIIGDEVPGGNGYYVKEKDKDRIYISETSGSYAFWFKKKLSFIDLSLTESIPTEDQIKIENIVLGGKVREKRIVLRPVTEKESSEKNNMDTYKIIEPYYFSPNPDKLSSFLTSVGGGLTAVEAVALVTSQKVLKDYGLDDPYSTLSYKYDGDTVKISIGDKDESDSTYYVMVDGKKVVYKVSSSVLTYADWKIGDILSSTVLVFIDSVESIRVKTGDVDYTYKLSGEDDDLKVTLNGKTLDTDNFRSLYQILLGGRASGQGDAERTETSPVLSVTFNYRDKDRNPVNIEYFKIDSRNYKQYVNDVPLNSVSASYINKVTKSLKDLLDGKEINTSY